MTTEKVKAMFNDLYELDKKIRTEAEEKQYTLYKKILRTLNLIEIYNDYSTKRKIKEYKLGR